MSGKGHPLPASEEARHNEIPERAEAEKGLGDDSAAALQPDRAITPDGQPYRYDDPGRGPASEEGGNDSTATDGLKDDQAAHQDRGQSVAAEESDRD